MKNKHLLIKQSFLYLFLISLTSCSILQKQSSEPAEFPSFDTESHRGGRGVMPENTIPAMLYTLSLDGITTLEMDVYVTSDNQMVVTHDKYLNPRTILKPDGSEIKKSESKDFAIMQMTYNELKEFDLGSKTYKLFPKQKKMKTSIPLLADLIDSVQQYIKKENKQQVFYNIEIKSAEADDNTLNPVPEKFVKMMMDMIKNKKITPYVIIQSADVRPLQVLNKKYPKIRTSYLVGSRRKNFTVEEDLSLLGFTPYIYSPNFKYLTKEEVEICHKKGMKVVAWTPNTKKEIEMLKAMGVDGIITDYPELLAE